MQTCKKKRVRTRDENEDCKQIMRTARSGSGSSSRKSGVNQEGRRKRKGNGQGDKECESTSMEDQKKRGKGGRGEKLTFSEPRSTEWQKRKAKSPLRSKQGDNKRPKNLVNVRRGRTAPQSVTMMGQGSAQNWIHPECDTQGNYCGPSRATGLRNPCGTRADRKAASNPPPRCTLLDR